MKKKERHWLAILFILTNSLLAQQQKDIWTNFRTSDGLATSHVQAMLESSDGTLWFGTSYGISCYRQGHWTTYRAGLANSNIHAIYQTQDRALWFGTDKGAIRFFRNQWTNFTADSGLVDYPIRSIFQSGDGAIWFGTDGGGVCRYYQNQWSHFTVEDGLAHLRVFAILESSDGSLWFGTFGGGVSRYAQGQWTTITVGSGLADNRVTAIVEASDGTIWFATAGGGISYLKGGMWSAMTTANGLISNFVHAICEASDGSLWFGTEMGVSRYREGVWKSYSVGDGLVDYNVRSIVEAADESIWFATIPSGSYSGGVSRFQEHLCTSFTIANGLLDNWVNSIFQSADGAMWFGTHGGISYYSQGKWSKITLENGLVNNYVQTIMQTANGNIWVGTAGGVSCYAKGSWKSFTQKNGLASDDVKAILESADHTLWFATSKGVSSLKQDKWTTFTSIDVLGSNFVSAIAQTADSAVWFATGRGLNRFYRGQWSAMMIPGGFEDNDVRTMIAASDGALWIGTFEKGVRRYKGGVWSVYRDQLASESIRYLYESRDGAIWVGTSMGVSRYYQGTWDNFAVACDLSSDYINAILESSDGNLWFGTREGVSSIRPDRLAPKTYIVQGPVENSLIGIANPLFIFDAVDRADGLPRLKFAWQILDSNLVPIAGNWSNFTSEKVIQPTITENGIYIFQVRSQDAWGNVDPKPVTRIFKADITPPTITIISPRTQDVVAGEVAIIGSAYDNSPSRDLSNYRLSYATMQEPTAWLEDRFMYYRDTTREIRNDTLAIWQTAGLANGNYWLHLAGYDKLGHISHEFVPVELAAACQFIDAQKGGYLCADVAGIEVYVPPNAMASDQQIYVKDTTFAQSDLLEQPQIHFVTGCFKVGPLQTLLRKPIRLTFTMADSLVPEGLERKLAIYHFAPSTRRWQRLGGTYQSGKRQISTTSIALGVFAIYDDLTQGGWSGIHNVNCQPRIFSPRGGGHDIQTAISFDLGQSANVTVKVYHPSGRLIRILKANERMSHGSNVVIWDGQDQDGRFCESGLYIVTIQAGEVVATKTVVVLNKY
ncbi:MAG: hypothetical protein ONB16_00965 [candidate division KSB1 bacterium]|nr:hypothetical protein [candidate division KSB1 bacterium]MDZ7340688.1 hypothetical protein [candidate division KSB1 bacterium]